MRRPITWGTCGLSCTLTKNVQPPALKVTIPSYLILNTLGGGSAAEVEAAQPQPDKVIVRDDDDDSDDDVIILEDKKKKENIAAWA
jgi:hypothetical protein